MTLIDILKKKRKIKEKKEVKETNEAESYSSPAKIKEEKETGKIYRILKLPHITEKATDLSKRNQYVFKVWPKANKIEIKKAIESLYKVNVLSVKIIKVPAKRRRLGRIRGWTKGYKKAIIKIKEGQKIEVLPR